MEEFILKQLQDVLYFSAVLNCVFENASFIKTTCKSFWWRNNWLPTATCLHISSEDSPEPTLQLKRRRRKNLKYIYSVLLFFGRRIFLFACELKDLGWKPRFESIQLFYFYCLKTLMNKKLKLIRSFHPSCYLSIENCFFCDPDVHCRTLVHPQSFFM